MYVAVVHRLGVPEYTVPYFLACSLALYQWGNVGSMPCLLGNKGLGIQPILVWRKGLRDYFTKVQLQLSVKNGTANT